jgi:hypothetical protein
MLWIVYWILLLGSGLLIASITLISRKKGDPKYIVPFGVLGVILVLSPFFSPTEVGPTGAKFAPGGIVSEIIFANAATKPKVTIDSVSTDTKGTSAPSFLGREILVAYRENRKTDAEILRQLLDAAGLKPTLFIETLESPLINIQYPSGIVRIVYKNKVDKQFVERIFDLIQYYRSAPEAEIAIGGPYETQIKGKPVQILLY